MKQESQLEKNLKAEEERDNASIDPTPIRMTRAQYNYIKQKLEEPYKQKLDQIRKNIKEINDSIKEIDDLECTSFAEGSDYQSFYCSVSSIIEAIKSILEDKE